MGGVCGGEAKAAHLQHGLRVHRVGARVHLVDGSPGHHPNHRIRLERLDRQGADPAAVPQHREAVADGEDLLEPVRDVDDAHAVRAHPPDQIEQHVDLPLGEAGGGLVHDDDPRLEGHGLGDLHQLLLGGGKPGHGQARIQIRGQGLEQFGAAPVHFAGVLEPAPARFAAEKDVVRHVQVGAEVELLMDEGDALLPGVPRVGQVDFRAGDLQLAPVRRDDAAEDLHQRALAGAILAHQHVHLPGEEVEIHLLQDLHVGVAERPAVAAVNELGDAAHGDQRFQHRLLTPGGWSGCRRRSPPG